MLIRISEPWAVVAWLAGVPYPKAFLDQAWRYLLQAQAHDSINGVTQDRTADDEVWRLNQVVEIGEMVADAALQEITRRADLSRFDPRDVLLLAFNALPFARTEILHAWVDIPTEWEVVDFDVVDPHGAILPLQKISRERRVVPVHQPNSRPWPFHVDRHEIYLGPVEVPSCGYRVFRVSPRRTQPAHVVYWPVPEETSTRSVMVAANQLENEHLRVEVQSDGTLNILNKMTGRLHRGLHYFEDGGDTGDYWVRRKPGHDRVFSTRGLPARVWTEKVCSLRATIVTEIKLRLPKRAEKDADRRSGEETDLTIRSAVTLDRQGPFLSFHTTFTNTAEDHRLRVLFPTDLESQFSDAEGHFTVDRRPVDPTLHPINGLWPEMWTHPQQSFVDLTDGESGFALVNDGLVEYEVLQDSRRTLAVTLLRAVRNEICTEFRVSGSFPEQKGGQSPGEHEFKYGVYFHLGDWRSGQVYQVARRFSVPLQIVQTAAHAGDLPEEASFFNLEPEALVLSALKRAEDRATCIVRLFNPTAQPVNGRLIFHHQVGRAREVTLNEEPGKDLFVAGGKAVQCRVEPGKIFTVEVEFVELHPSL